MKSNSQIRSIMELCDGENGNQSGYSITTYSSKNQHGPSQEYYSPPQVAWGNKSNMTASEKNRIKQKLNQTDLPATSKKRVHSFDKTNRLSLQTSLSGKKKRRQDPAQFIQSDSSSSEVSVHRNDVVIRNKRNEFSKDIKTGSKEQLLDPHKIINDESLDGTRAELDKPLSNLQTEQTMQNTSNLKACFIEIINNIESMLTKFGSRLSYLRDKYLDDERNYQEDAENLMFLVNCIMSKLKEEITNKESDLKNSYDLWHKQLDHRARFTRNYDMSSNEDVVYLSSQDSSETDKDKRFSSCRYRENPLHMQIIKLSDLKMSNNKSALQDSSCSNSNSVIFENLQNRRKKSYKRTKHSRSQKLSLRSIENSNVNSDFVKPVEAEKFVVRSVERNSSKENDVKGQVDSTPNKMPASTVKRSVRDEYEPDSDVNSTRSTVIYNPMYKKRKLCESESDDIFSSNESNSSIDGNRLKMNKDHVLEDSNNKSNSLPSDSNTVFRDCSPVLSEIIDLNIFNGDEPLINSKSSRNIPPTKNACKTVGTSTKDTVRTGKFKINDRKLKMDCYVYLRKLEDSISIP